VLLQVALLQAMLVNCCDDFTQQDDGRTARHGAFATALREAGAARSISKDQPP
jgi:hypothetical protein